jgi:hypothetical protein
VSSIGQPSIASSAQGAGGFHELKLDVAPGQQLSNVSVRFTNDAYEGKAETDRNMYVDAIEVNGKRFEAEGPSCQVPSRW